MASILDRYGIKEVADVTFYTIDEATGKPKAPVLYLDSLKVSTLEQTAETVYAQGGKGNPRLIGWDFGKEITLSLEDALFSPKSMAVMFGNGTVDASVNEINKTVTVVAVKDSELNVSWTDAKGATHAVDTYTIYNEAGEEVKKENVKKDERYFATFKVAVAGQTITVGPDSFPGTLAA